MYLLAHVLLKREKMDAIKFKIGLKNCKYER